MISPFSNHTQGCTVLTPETLTLLERMDSQQLVFSSTQEKQPLKNILAVLKLTKSNTNLFNRKITIMKVKVSNYNPKAFLSDTQQIWHKKCLTKLIILAKAHEMLLSTRIWKQTNWYITISISLVSTGLHRNKFTRQSQYKHIHTSIHESIHTIQNCKGEFIIKRTNMNSK